MFVGLLLLWACTTLRWRVKFPPFEKNLAQASHFHFVGVLVVEAAVVVVEASFTSSGAKIGIRVMVRIIGQRKNLTTIRNCFLATKITALGL